MEFAKTIHSYNFPVSQIEIGKTFKNDTEKVQWRKNVFQMITGKSATEMLYLTQVNINFLIQGEWLQK